MVRSLIVVPLLIGSVVGNGWTQEPAFETTRLAEGVYQFRFRSHNGFFVVTDDGVVAVDPISTEAAARYAEEIRRVAPGRGLAAVVYSHDHADHATGANVLREALGRGAPIIAHASAAAKVVAAGDSTLPPPDVTFTDRLSLHFGGRQIELHFLGKSHSDNMVVTYLPAERLAFAVDFVSNDRVGYRDLPDYHFPDFFAALERLQALEFDRVAFGHGAPGDRASIERQIGYYRDLRAAVEQAVAQGWTESQAAERVRLPAYADWGGYENWFPLNVRAIYRWLAERDGGGPGG